MKFIIINTNANVVPMNALVFQKSVELKIEKASYKTFHSEFIHGKWFTSKLEVSALGDPCDEIALHDFTQSSYDMRLLTKLGLKSELASLFNKSLLDEYDALVNKK